MIELDREEREVLDAYHEGRLERVALDAREVEAYREAARAVARKNRRVNIRLSARDLEDLQVRAREEGMPYQTLMASVLHKYAAGELVPKE
jgi:predicted DNA binding CopG/RHH family protein